jgi:predicted nucleic acid-binding protein
MSTPIPNPNLSASLLEVVDNQLKEGSPPETRKTYARLVASGYSDKDARHLIGQVVLSEIFNVMKRKESYDEARFIEALKRLPLLPEDDE